jgi:glycosyltransferase involved in cell wall biosynthesis
MGSMRIAQILPQLKVGGAERHVMLLVEYLRRQDLRVDLITLKRGAIALEQRAQAVADARLDLGFRWRRAPIAFARLRRYLKHRNIQVLHGHLPLADLLGRMAGEAAGVPVLVTTEHGKHLWKRAPYRWLERRLAARTAMRFCVSDDIRRLRLEREGTPPEKLRLLPNFVDPQAYSREASIRRRVRGERGWSEEDVIFLTVGRLVQAKDHRLLVKAFARMRSRGASRLVLVGEGPERSSLEEFRVRSGLEERVELLGERHDVEELLAAADVFVLSSRVEGLPVSMLEAMAASLPVVAPAVGGIPDALRDGREGRLVPAGDSEALAAALEESMENEARRRAWGEAGRRRVLDCYDVRTVAGELARTYRELWSSLGGGA